MEYPFFQMARTELALNGMYVFKFSKFDGDPARTSSNPIAQCVLEHFLAHPHRIQLNTKALADEFFNWAHVPNRETDPYYLLEFSLVFDLGPAMVGGLAWEVLDFSSESRLELGVPTVQAEDDDFQYIGMRIEANLIWDMKPQHWQKITESIERQGGRWEDSRIEIQLTFRANGLFSRVFPAFKRGMDVPVSEQTATNLAFVLERMPPVVCVVFTRPPEKPWEWEAPHWNRASAETVQFSGKFLARYNDLIAK